MRIGLFAVGGARMAGTALLRAIAINAERLGFATLWVPEHVVLLDKYSSQYPYSENGQLPAPTTAPIPDPFLTLASMATVTSKIRLATGICLVPEHNPLVLAKVVATLDFLSNGRCVLGVGIGWLEEEFKAIGVPWERRAQRTREYIEAMRTLWGDELSSYAGEFVRFEGVRSYPKPVRGAKLPVFFGGESAPALRRVGQLRQRVVRVQPESRRSRGQDQANRRIAQRERAQPFGGRVCGLALHQTRQQGRPQALSRRGRRRDGSRKPASRADGA